MEQLLCIECGELTLCRKVQGDPTYRQWICVRCGTVVDCEVLDDGDWICESPTTKNDSQTDLRGADETQTSEE